MKVSFAAVSALFALLGMRGFDEATAQSIYRSDLGVFASIDFAESVVRGHDRLEGPGFGGRFGFRSEHVDLGLFVRRAGDQDYGDQRWSSGSITFGPSLGLTYRRKGHVDGVQLTTSAWFVRDDHTVRVNPFDGPTEYRQGADIVAYSLRGAVSYFREVSLSEMVSVLPMIGVYGFLREEFPTTEYYFPNGEETAVREPRRRERSVGMLGGLPLMVEIAPGHVVGLEPLIEVDPIALVFGSVGLQVSLAYNL